jgi:hypothetical protein
MKQHDSILTPAEIQLCLVLQALIQELAVLIKQVETLQQRNRPITIRSSQQ